MNITNQWSTPEKIEFITGISFIFSKGGFIVKLFHSDENKIAGNGDSWEIPDLPNIDKYYFHPIDRITNAVSPANISLRTLKDENIEVTFDGL